LSWSTGSEKVPSLAGHPPRLLQWHRRPGTRSGRVEHDTGGGLRACSPSRVSDERTGPGPRAYPEGDTTTIDVQRRHGAIRAGRRRRQEGSGSPPPSASRRLHRGARPDRHPEDGRARSRRGGGAKGAGRAPPARWPGSGPLCWPRARARTRRGHGLSRCSGRGRRRPVSGSQASSCL